MGKLLLKDKSIVVPGEGIAEGMDYLPGFGTYREKEMIIANKLGLLSMEGRAVKIIPLSGQYIPKKDDVIIAKVIDLSFNGWRVDTNSAYSAMLSLKDATSDYIARGADLTRFYNVGDIMVCRVTNVTSQKLVDVTTKGLGLRKLHGGRIIPVNTNKVPRIIGKQGSMVSMIKDSTGCKITVGQNGLVWLEGLPEKELIAVKAIKKIEKESTLSGLTDRIKAFLEKETGKKLSVKRG